MHPSRQLRSDAAAALEAARQAGAYTLDDFVVRESYVPMGTIEGLQARPVVTCIALELTEERRSRGAGGVDVLRTGELPLQVAIQAAVDPADVIRCDRLLDWVDEIKGTLRGLAGWRWLRTRPLADQQGLPYDYARLREAQTWEAILTPWYVYSAV